MKRARLHSAAKSLSWRVFSTMVTIIISYIVTHKIDYALYIGVFEFISKLGLFYCHERIWENGFFALLKHKNAHL